MSTKKQPTADLPTKTKSTYVRPSRAKAAVAARAAAKVVTAEITGDWSKVSDRQVQLADQATDLGNRAAVIANEVEAIGKSVDAGLVDRDTVLDTVAEDVRQAFLEAETTAAVADLDVDVETVRSLADAGLGPDPFGFDDMPADINEKDVEAAAAARLGQEWAPGKTVTLNVRVGYAGPGVHLPGLPSIAERLAVMNCEEALPMIEKEYALDDNCADGSVFAVIGSQAVIDMLDSLLPDEDVRREQAETRLLAARATKLELDNAQRHPPQTISDEDFETMNAQHDRILELEESLGDVQRLLATRNTENERLTGELQAAADSSNARREAHLNERLSDGARIRGFLAEAAKGKARIIELGSELDAAEDRIGHLDLTLADAQRGFFARLFGKGAR